MDAGRGPWTRARSLNCTTLRFGSQSVVLDRVYADPSCSCGADCTCLECLCHNLLDDSEPRPWLEAASTDGGGAHGAGATTTKRGCCSAHSTDDSGAKSGCCGGSGSAATTGQDERRAVTSGDEEELEHEDEASETEGGSCCQAGPADETEAGSCCQAGPADERTKAGSCCQTVQASDVLRDAQLVSLVEPLLEPLLEPPGKRARKVGAEPTGWRALLAASQQMDVGLKHEAVAVLEEPQAPAVGEGATRPKSEVSAWSKRQRASEDLELQRATLEAEVAAMENEAARLTNENLRLQHAAQLLAMIDARLASLANAGQLPPPPSFRGGSRWASSATPL